MSSADVPRDEAEAALAARQELGPEMEPALVDAFVDRIERSIDARVDARLSRQGHGQAPERPGRGPFGETLVPLASLAMAIPLTAVAGGTVGFAGILAVWIGIVLVNLAHALRR